MTGWRSRESLLDRPSRRNRHGDSRSEITLSASRDIPFNKLVLSQANVRRVKAGVSIEELAEDIARRTLLQGLSVRPSSMPMAPRPACSRSRPAAGASARWNCWSSRSAWPRQRRSPASCAIGADLAEEDSLAENVQRVALHPLDQFRAFQALREKGLGDEEIAARVLREPDRGEAAPAPRRRVARSFSTSMPRTA